MTLFKIKNQENVPDTFKRLVDDLLGDVNDAEKSFLPQLNPKTNIIERETGFEIQLALPGWNKKEIELSVAEGVLTIKGSKKDFAKDKAIWYRKEITFGKFEKQFKLPEEAGEEINAELQHGLLKVTIEKVKKVEARRSIQVS